MITALKAAASGMEAQQAQIESIANNLANVNTTGFKKSRAEFQDLLYETLQEPGAKTSAQTQSPIGLQRGLGVRVSGTQRNFEMGVPNNTQRDLDMMIRGEGFFVIQTPRGELGYRRDGTFYKSATGRVVTMEGYPLQPEMVVPQETRRIQISGDGIVTARLSPTESVDLGQIQLATFSNNGGLKAIGKNIFLETNASGPAQLETPGQGVAGQIMQYYLEGSNVNPIEEMTAMISAQRAFEMNSKVIHAVDQMLQHTANIR